MRKSFGKRLGREQTGLGNGEAIQVDIGAIGPIQMLQVDNIMVARVVRLDRISNRQPGIITLNLMLRQLK